MIATGVQSNIVRVEGSKVFFCFLNTPQSKRCSDPPHLKPQTRQLSRKCQPRFFAERLPEGNGVPRWRGQQRWI